MSPPYPLDQKLPPHVLAHTWWNYNTFNFPVYSWSWFWRYALLLGPVALSVGLAYVLRIGQVAHEWPLALQAASRICTVFLVVALLSPALGSWIRHRDFDSSRERHLLIGVVAVSLGVAWLGRVWFMDFLEEVARPILIAKGYNDNSGPAVIPSTQLASTVGFWIIALWCSVEPFYAYYAELRRWNHYASAREIEVARQQRDAADLRLTVLQSQVEPHFLYNTLASVRSLVGNDPRRAEATIDALVDHLRATLPKLRDSQLAAATLADQVEMCRSYLEVMCVRMGGRLTYSIDVPLDLSRVMFPPLMLMSLVENAIKHGVEPKPGSCSIAVAARLNTSALGDVLETSVTDNGAGLREGPSKGLGLANIRAQLATRYGDKGALSLEYRTGGTVATIRIPVEQTPA